ncbi:hypothetical protein BN59_01474 [Legionella massiliensis]|uniref:Uncharacterized protein n=1 Tax=Legionella massiliensis TaxID=1034943 RepID=A0A078KW08_9GAMM|nr:hypothetical protein [Legionella massiliensis]CDZ77192.1 hypothetical protein BN59_01474 [Legionella massiliensis]CEE12930.1 hypothetical protein BN1094_01474 [Legionella massiliensis]
MAKMKHESIQPSTPVEGMTSSWITIRVVDNEYYEHIKTITNDYGNNYDKDIYISAADFAARPFDAISEALGQKLQSEPLLLTKEMERTSTKGMEQTATSMDIYLATYIVEVQLPTATIEATKKNTTTLYQNAFELPQGSSIKPEQVKRMVLDVLTLERHVLLFANKPTKELQNHEVAVFKENDSWFYLLAGDEQVYDLPNEYSPDWRPPFYKTLDHFRNDLRGREYRDFTDTRSGKIGKKFSMQVLTQIAAAGHVPSDFGLDYHFPLEVTWIDPVNLALTLNQAALQSGSNFSKLPADLLDSILAAAADKNPVQVTPYMNQMNSSVKEVYNGQIVPQLICKADWGPTPSLTFSCPSDLPLVDKFYKTGLIPFNEFVKLDKKNYQITIQSSNEPGVCGVYKANQGKELAIAFASQEQRDAWASLMGLKHDFYNEGVGIWGDRPNSIYFTEKYFTIQEVKKHIVKKQQEREGFNLYLEEAAKDSSSPQVSLGMFGNMPSTVAMTQHMTESLKACNEQIVASKLLLDVLRNKMSAEDLQDKYAPYVSVIKEDEALAGIWEQVEKKTALSHGA